MCVVGDAVMIYVRVNDVRGWFTFDGMDLDDLKQMVDAAIANRASKATP
jgi:hypothetical protein